MRRGRSERATGETKVSVEVYLDGTGNVDVSTGIGFFDHMLAQLGRHGGFDLRGSTVGDLSVGAHHTVEDTALALGAAFREALGDKAGVVPVGAALGPPGEGLGEAAGGPSRPPVPGP